MVSWFLACADTVDVRTCRAPWGWAVRFASCGGMAFRMGGLLRPCQWVNGRMGEWAKVLQSSAARLSSPTEGVDALREAKRRMELINNEATGAVGGAGGGPI